MGQWLLLLALGIVLQHLKPAPNAGFGEVGISIGAVGVGHTAVGRFKILRHLYKMKLIIAIVQDDDASRLISTLMNEGYSVTKLATTGGFLRAGNTTLLLGGEDDRVKGALDVIERVCKSRKQIATSPSPVAGTSGVYAPYPIEVVVGGATVFVLDVEQFVKF